VQNSSITKFVAEITAINFFFSSCFLTAILAHVGYIIARAVIVMTSSLVVTKVEVMKDLLSGVWGWSQNLLYR